MNINELYEDICKINKDYGILCERYIYYSDGLIAEEDFAFSTAEYIIKKYDIKIDINEYQEKYDDWAERIYYKINRVLKLKLMEIKCQMILLKIL